MKVAYASASTTDDTIEALSPFFPGVRFGGSGPEQLRFELDAYVAGDVWLTDYAIEGREIQMTTDMPGFMVGESAMDGAMTLGRDPIDVDVPVAIPHHGLDAKFASVHARAIQLDTEAVLHFVHLDLGDDHFDLHNIGTSPLTPEGSERWHSVADFVHRSMVDGSADVPLMNASISQLLVATYLTTFPTTWLDARRPVNESVHSTAAVRRAKAFIDDNRHLPIQVTDVAEAARMSVRGLQELFRRETGQTPMQYLRTARLEAAHRDLRAADPTLGDTVGEIAQRWGFAQLPRFAAAYREQYGEYPSQTLRR
jgi:AraC-like DNA-binding protein